MELATPTASSFSVEFQSSPSVFEGGDSKKFSHFDIGFEFQGQIQGQRMVNTLASKNQDQHFLCSLIPFSVTKSNFTSQFETSGT